MQHGPADIILTGDENLALRPGVRIVASMARPSGGGAHDPQVLLNETAHRLDGRPIREFDQSHTYNTYDGQNLSNGPDWYAIEFPEPVMFNCIEMTMGLPYRDGGWWTSLRVEVRLESSGPWKTVDPLSIMPPYVFEDARRNRRPYETHALTFNQVMAHAVRVIGFPGGVAQFTALARLAVYHRDLSRWNPARLPDTPLPRLFRLIAPETVWELSENLAKLTGLTIRFPMMEYYLAEHRQQQHWRRIQHNYHGQPDLWFLLGEASGWNTWNTVERMATQGDIPDAPHVRVIFHDTLASAVAPLVVDGELLGEMRTHYALLKDGFDWQRHKRYAAEHAIDWSLYEAAVKHSLHMSREQLEGAAALLGLFANSIPNLVHRNLQLQRELDHARRAMRQGSRQPKEIVQQAIDFMQANLEVEVGVSDVARSVALAPSYFCTIFTAETGRSPIDYLIDLRLERAKEYLARTPMSVLEVCDALGYTPSYFSRLFKSRVGCTPGQFAAAARTR
jgi:AraC-like DNA-binding protein